MMIRRILAMLMITAIYAAMAHAAVAHSRDYASGNAVGSDLPAAGQVRAQVTGGLSETAGGLKYEARAGDIRLWNNNAMFVISGLRDGNGYSPFGGNIEEAAVRANGTWRNLFGDTFLLLHRKGDPLMEGRLLKADSVAIIKDGADGEAIVRVTGKDNEFAIRKDIFGIATKTMNLDFTVDYVLKPDTTTLEIRVKAKSPANRSTNLYVAQGMLMGDDEEMFVPGPGFNDKKFGKVESPYTAATSQGISYAWFASGTTVLNYDKLEAYYIARMGRMSIPDDGTDGEVVYYLTAAAGGASRAAEQAYIANALPYGIIEGDCSTRQSGTPAEGVMIHAITPDETACVAFDFCDSEGHFRLAVPPGDYIVTATAYDREPGPRIQLSIGSGETSRESIEIDAPATVEYSIKDQNGDPIPAQIAFKPLSAPASPRFPEWHFRSDDERSRGVFTHLFNVDAGPGSITVTPGRYEVYISRGLEYEIDNKTLTLSSGAGTSFTSAIARSVNTSGFLSGDFHIHAHPSHDASTPVFERLLNLAAVNVEIPVATDHDVITDYSPYLEKTSLSKWLKPLIGEEITTKRMGHYNDFPLPHDVTKRNNGAIEWIGKSIPSLFDEIRAIPTKPLIQLNHPRDTTMGYFDHIGYDPDTGTAKAKPGEYSTNFDIIEVLNGTSFERAERVMADWYSFLNQGYRVTGSGNSDSHRSYDLSVGYPRNCVVSPTDDPAKTEESVFMAALRAQKSTVNGGAFINFNINGAASIGDMVTDTDGMAELNIDVQAPTWIKVDSISIIANGALLQRIPVNDRRGVSVFRSTIPVNPSGDTWYQVRADGAEPLFPVYPAARVYSFTNPIYVDVDGNGKFDPPMKAPAAAK